jgi:acetyl-CoA carboxylase biotin carboxyl carrier protein
LPDDNDNATQQTEEKRGVGKEILTYDDLLQIVELIKSAEAFSEFHLKIGEIELDLRKANSGAVHGAALASSVTHAAPKQPEAPKAASPSSTGGAAAPVDRAPSVPAADAASGARPRAQRSAVQIPPGSVVIDSPMVGTFYRRPEPGARPFVELGDTVDSESTVCIIEVMKLMNSIPAGCRGRVTHILVEDAEPVEAGQPLIVIDPR